MRSEIDRPRPTELSLGAPRSLGRHELLVVVAFATTVACFVASTAYVERKVSEITDRSHVVSDGVLPRLVDLSDMRADLRRMARTVSDPSQRSDLRPAIAAVLNHADASRRRYEAAASVRASTAFSVSSSS